VAPAPAAPDAGALIEFPKERSQEALARPTSLPDWRVELNEKVRAIKARRQMQARVNEAAGHKPITIEPGPEPAAEPAAEVAEEPVNPIVTAALNRVRRASENAARAQAAVAAPARREATARVVVPAPEVEHCQPPPPVQEEHFDAAELLEGFDDTDFLDDSLDQEVAAISARTKRLVAGAPVALRGLAAIVDVGVVALTTVPFVVAVLALGGDLARPEVQGLAAMLALVLAGFYLFATISMGGQTVGMRLVGLRVVRAGTEDPASPRLVLARVIGYFLAALPFGLGILWILVNRERCGWHDLLSNTRVVQQ
jgi:uncharacterized RDD family membrane protein YckC